MGTLYENATQRRKRIKQQDRIELAKMWAWFAFCVLCFASFVLVINVYTKVCVGG